VNLLAALAAAVFVYFAVGFVVGSAPRLPWPTSRRGGDLSESQVWLIQAGVELTPAKFRLWSMGVGVVGFGFALAVTGSVWIAVPPAVALMFLPRWFYARRRVQRLGEVLEAWPDGLRHLVASVRSGLSLPVALDELARNGPDGLRTAFARYPTLAQVFGVRAALEIVRDELADPTTDRVIEVLILATERGGALVPSILHDLADATNQDIRTLEEIRTNSLEQRLNARVVFAIPWLVLVLLTARPSAYREFYQSSAGFVVVAIAAVLSAIGSWWVARLGREPDEQRVFGGASAGMRL
jgi:tight adherence protein B